MLSPVIGVQPPIGDSSTAPTIVTASAVAVETSKVGMACGMRLVARSRTVQKATQASDHKRIDVEPVEAGPHDDQHAGEADGDRQPAPPADGLAEEQRRAHRDGQRQRLQDGRDVGDRQMRQAR